MKKNLLTALAVTLSLCGVAQTKGTNAVSLGITSYSNKTDYGDATDHTEQKTNNFTLGYGLFISDNKKIELELSYGKTENNSHLDYYLTNDSKTYGGSFSYQQYYPLIKTLYAYAGGKASYLRGEQKANNLNDQNPNLNAMDATSNAYSAGAYGGLTWFVSKRFAFETNLLSANISHHKSTVESKSTYEELAKTTITAFDLTTRGFINDLGFKIYLLF